MPTNSIFFGIVVQMYWRDHPPPHVHVFYQGHEGLVAIGTGDIIAGHLPPSALRIVRPWIERRRPELMDNWDRARRLEPFQLVPGADVE